jgi:hypothetical protein
MRHQTSVIFGSLLFSGLIWNYVSNLYYTQTNFGISNEVWSKLMYKQVNMTSQGLLSDCKIRCFFEPGSKCTVLAFESPICYLGDPRINDTISQIDKTVNLWTNYGN